MQEHLKKLKKDESEVEKSRNSSMVKSTNKSSATKEVNKKKKL
jgi:hypothetical protein